MFKSGTVFVIGAGASAEFGFPIGSGLSDIIRDGANFRFDRNGGMVKGNLFIHMHFASKFDKTKPEMLAAWNECIAKSQQIARGIDSAESIDEYIYRYSDDKLITKVGKIFIAHAISTAEEQSILHELKGFGNSISNAYKTWIWGFYKSLISGVTAKNIGDIGKGLKIITFNYDRTIEHFLECALPLSFEGMTRAEARDIVNQLDILHPYGSLGSLETLPYGDTNQFADMARTIITWSEKIETTETIDKIRLAIEKAERIVFMGFGFAKQNMRILEQNGDKLLARALPVYSTGVGRNKETENSLRYAIADIYSGGTERIGLELIHFQYGSGCREFFDIHRLNFTR